MTSLPFEDLPPPHCLNIELGVTEFYTAYPRKVGPRKMAEAYRKAIRRGVAHADIMAGVVRYKANKPEYQDWMYPATFLNGDHCYNEYNTLSEVKAGIHGGAWKGESLETIAQTVIKYGQSWARCRYPRDVLEQCAAKGLLTDDQLAEALR